MAIKITIEGREVKNPLARLVLALIATLVFFILFALMLFLLVPFIWFAALAGMIMVIGLLIMAPRFISRFRAIQQNKNNLP